MRRIVLSRFGLILSVLLTSARFCLSAPSDKIDFQTQIRPILSDKCFFCHGPDDEKRKAKLRLDQLEGIHKVVDEAKSMRVFAPKDLDHSEAFRRITTKDPEDQMPPPKSKLNLSPEEIALIQKWIEQGAEANSRPHWAFISVAPVPVPTPTNTAGIKSPIDAFIRVRVEAESLKPSSEASRETLLRRLALDLTGLPPTLKEFVEFQNDTSPNAYEKRVEYYLALPAYGERMANDWVDLARYADTYGYQADVDRDMSPWRDWVINAFNRNLPYNDFLLWQIAGDLLPGATREQILATAFNRLHRQTNEGGSIEEEFRNEYVSDRIHTFGTAMLGLTLECCRCHDHKYDPIRQRDYYSFGAFFNNIDESGLYSHFTTATPTPTLLLYPEGVEARHNRLLAEILSDDQKLQTSRAGAKKRFERWLSTNKTSLTIAQPVAEFAFDSITNNASPGKLSTNHLARLSESPALVAGHQGKALEFSGDNSATVKGVGAFGRTDPFSFSLWLKPSTNQTRAVIFHRSRAWTDSGSRGYEMLLEDGKPSFSLIHFYPGNAIKVMARQALPLNQWSQITITYDGSSKAAGLTLYLNGVKTGTEVVRDNLYREITHRSEWGDGEVGGVELTLAARFRDVGFKNGAIDDFKVYNTCLAALEVAGSDLKTASRQDLLEYFLAHEDREQRVIGEDLHMLRQAENGLVNGVREIMVMKEMSGRRPTFVLKRGSYTTPGDPVEPGTPERIFAFSPELPKNRLGLGQWLIDRRNPLTARVVVNRLWRMHFGSGIVATQEDFGNQGQRPTHPELLDWLAGHFMDNGWDVKALHRLIVNSATYRQTSAATPEQLAADPENRLLARGPKHRLLAEQIRDSALAASGLLTVKVGGPSVKPYQPAGLWEEAGTGKSYTPDKGEKLYRRSLYTFWRRTAPPPSMLTFDATSREVCTAKRETTATPLQALVLLNDPQFLEAARVLAQKLMTNAPAELSTRIVIAYQSVLNRQARPAEIKILTQLYQEQLDYFQKNPDAVEKYLRIGETPRDAKLPGAELAATTVLTSALFNHDDFVMLR